MKKQLQTLCFFFREVEILLARKKRGFGKDRLNGYGGKRRPGESVRIATIREVLEESTIVVHELEERGMIDFVIDDLDLRIRCHVFVATDWSGEAVETEEMRPQWLPIASLSDIYDQMWPADRL